MSGAPTIARPRVLPRRPGGGVAGRLSALVREQALVAGGQLLAGLGNLAFALVTVRLLDPAAFAQLAAFLALYLLVYVPAGSLSAGSALRPELARSARRRAVAGGAGVGALALVAGLAFADALRLPAALVVALAAAAPAAGLLALERGRLYGQARHGRAVASLLVEPAVRLTAGVALAGAIGASGAAIGVALAGWAALAVAATGRGRTGEPGAAAGHLDDGDIRGAGAPARAAAGRSRAGDTRGSALAVGAFLLLALVQSQDVLFANAALAPADAGRFAVVSTLGGIAAFATTTVPLVLIPRAAAGDRGALATAVAAAAALGGGAVVVVALAAEPLIALVFGARYAEVAPLAAPYLGAMALLGVARVLVAHATATGAGRPAVALLAAAAAGHLALLVAIGDNARGVAAATLASAAALTVALATVSLAGALGGAGAAGRLPLVGDVKAAAGERLARARAAVLSPAGLTLIALTLVALALRLIATRSLWLDEATTWYQASLPFETLLADLRATDVHPPLHHALVWLSVRGFGDSELALRLPSLIAGTALVPVLFGAGRALYDRRTGLIAAALGTAAPILIWYSQEARMYALVMLLAVIAVWAQIRAVRDGGARYWAIYAVVAAAMVWTHYFAALLVAVLGLTLVAGVIARRHERGLRGPLTGAAAATVATVVLLAPLVPFAVDQFFANEAAGRGFDQPAQAGDVRDQGPDVSPYAALTNGVWALWGYHSSATMAKLTSLWPLVMLLALLALGRGRSHSSRLLMAAAVVPAILLVAIATQKPFLFELRYNLPAVPIALLLIARGLGTWPRGRVLSGVAVGAVVVTLLAGFADQQLNGTNPRVYDFEGSLSEIEQRSDPGDVVLYEPSYLNNVIAYYAPEIDARELDPADLPRVREGQRVFVLGSFQDKPEHREPTRTALRELRAQGRLVDRFSRPQVEVWGFGR